MLHLQRTAPTEDFPGIPCGGHGSPLVRASYVFSNRSIATLSLLFISESSLRNDFNGLIQMPMALKRFDFRRPFVSLIRSTPASIRLQQFRLPPRRSDSEARCNRIVSALPVHQHMLSIENMRTCISGQDILLRCKVQPHKNCPFSS